jgi:hypothetical protein
MLKAPEDETLTGCLQEAHTRVKTFLAFVFSFLGLLPLQRRLQDYAEFNAAQTVDFLREMGRVLKPMWTESA